MLRLNWQEGEMEPNGALFLKENLGRPRESEKKRANLSSLVIPNWVNPNPISVHIRAKAERSIREERIRVEQEQEIG